MRGKPQNKLSDKRISDDFKNNGRIIIVPEIQEGSFSAEALVKK